MYPMLLAVLWTVIGVPDFSCPVQAVTVTLRDADIDLWVSKISTDLASFRTSLGATKIENEFIKNGVTSKGRSEAQASQLLQSVRRRIENLLWKSENNVKNIRIQAEKSYAGYAPQNYSCSDFTTYPYLRAAAILKKEVASTAAVPAVSSTTRTRPAPAAAGSVDYCVREATLELNPDPRLYGVETNRKNSTSHVPPNIYDASNEILNVANWTRSLDDVYIANAQSDSTLKWQYFGTTDGMFKIYPGIQWYVQTRNYTQKDMPIDMFDCRTQYWYLLAATYPQDMVILIDNSGSMKGSGSIMANKTLTEILHTLNVNDFFNVVMFMNMSIKYVSDAFNRTMLQATEMNKNKIMELISNDEKKKAADRQFSPQGVSDFRLALVEAFELLRMAKNQSASASAGGVQTIMLITDSAPEDFADLFTTYNPDRQIRLFTFLIGQEATDVETVKSIACRNRGYFVQIATLADVKENVQQYVPVLARTNAQLRDYFFVWTGVHQNQIKTQKNKLFASVAQAAYDTRLNHSVSNGVGKLIGVAGLDVPVNQFERLGPTWELGLMAYIFMATNNGFIVFHPEFRPVNEAGDMQMFYNNQDIADIEFPADSTPANGKPSYDLPLRIAMIQRLTGAIDMVKVKTFDDMSRGMRQQFRYFYAPLNSTAPAGLASETRPTPFSLGLALPWRSGGQWPPVAAYPNLSPTQAYSLSRENLVALLSKRLANRTCDAAEPTSYKTGLADFEFCDFPSELLAQYSVNPLCALASVLEMPPARQQAMRCSIDYLNRVLVDAASTRVAAQDWEKNWKVTARAQLGARLLFLWTGTGLARWQAPPAGDAESIIDASFAAARRNGSRDSIYERTALLASASGTSLTVMTAPSGESVTARVKANTSVPIYLTSALRVESSVVGVVGAELNYDRLAEYFVRATNSCASGGSGVCITCARTDVRCYLLDGSGAVVVSESQSDVGKTFDVVNCPAMRLMINRSLFVTTKAYDFQAACLNKISIDSSASTLFNPIRALMRLASWALIEGYLLLSNLTSSVFQVIKAGAQEFGMASPGAAEECHRVDASRPDSILKVHENVDALLAETADSVALLPEASAKLQELRRRLMQPLCISRAGDDRDEEAACEYLCKRLPEQFGIGLVSDLLASCPQFAEAEVDCTIQRTLLRRDSLQPLPVSGAMRLRCPVLGLCEACMPGANGSSIFDVYARQVTGTNLIFVAVTGDPNCDCTGCPPAVTTEKISSMRNLTVPQRYRERPPWSRPNIVLTDNATICSKAAVPSLTNQAQLSLVSSLVLLTFLAFSCES